MRVVYDALYVVQYHIRYLELEQALPIWVGHGFSRLMETCNCGPLLRMEDTSPETYCIILFYFDFTTSISQILVQH